MTLSEINNITSLDYAAYFMQGVYLYKSASFLEETFPKIKKLPIDTLGNSLLLLKTQTPEHIKSEGAKIALFIISKYNSNSNSVVIKEDDVIRWHDDINIFDKKLTSELELDCREIADTLNIFSKLKLFQSAYNFLTPLNSDLSFVLEFIASAINDNMLTETSENHINLEKRRAEDNKKDKSNLYKGIRFLSRNIDYYRTFALRTYISWDILAHEAEAVLLYERALQAELFVMPHLLKRAVAMSSSYPADYYMNEIEYQIIMKKMDKNKEYIEEIIYEEDMERESIFGNEEVVSEEEISKAFKEIEKKVKKQKND